MARSVINVLVNADPKAFKKGMGEAERTLDKFGDAAKRSAKLVAGVGLAMGAAAGAFAVQAIKAGEAASTANARLDQIAESMGLFGDEATTVSGRLQDLAKEQAKLTGVNQNTIKESQALLLTFAGVAQTADEMGGSFDRATQLTLDMAAAGFGSATDNAKQLGKALNDPIKGISALARSGVTFTEEQKAVIESLVESGDLLAAQDLILSEIETQVGGTAEATANASDKMKVAFSQVSESVGLVLLPYFNALVDYLIANVIPKFEEFAVTTVQKIITAVGDARDAFGLLRDRFGEVREAAALMADTIRDRVNAEVERARDFAQEYNDELILAAGAVSGVIGALVAYQTAAAAMKGVMVGLTVAQVILNVAMAANPVMLIVLAIAALIGLLVAAYFRFESVRKIVDTVFGVLKDAAIIVWEFIQGAWAALLDALDSLSPTIDKVVAVFNIVKDAVVDFVQRAQEALGPLGQWFEDNVVSTIAAGVEFFTELFRQLYDFLAPIVGAIIDLIAGIATVVFDAIGTITDIILGFIDAVAPLFALFWDGLKLVVETAFNAIKAIVESSLAIIRGLFEAGTALLKGDFSGVWDALTGIVTDSLDSIKEFVSNTFDGIIDFLRGVPSKIADATVGLFDGIKNAFREAVNFIIRAWNGLEFKIPGFDPPGPGPSFPGFTLGLPDIPQLAKGGIVTGPTLALIGEAGPEAVVPLSGRNAGMGGVSITVNAGVGDPGAIGQSVVEAIVAYERRNGSGWRAA